MSQANVHAFRALVNSDRTVRSRLQAGENPLEVAASHNLPFTEEEPATDAGSVHQDAIAHV